MKKLLFSFLFFLSFALNAQVMVVNAYKVQPLVYNSSLQLLYDFANLDSYPKTGTTVTDLSGNGRNATLVNGVGFSASNAGQVTFDGVDDYAITSYSIAGSTNVSISIWAKHGASTVNRTLIAFHGNGTRIFGLVIASALKVDFAYNINNVPALVTPSAPFVVGTWYHYTLTYDSGANQVKAYVNGIYATGASVSGAWTNPGGTVSLYLGAVSTSADFHQSAIGMVWVNTQTLTAAQVLSNFEATKSRYGY